MRLYLIGDVLDEQLVDVKGINAGRVDGIVLSVFENAPPRVTHVEVGPITMLGRFSLRFATWYARFDRRFGAQRGRPFRIPWANLRRETHGFGIDRELADTPINVVDRWLCEKVVRRIPGS